MPVPIAQIGSYATTILESSFLFKSESAVKICFRIHSSVIPSVRSFCDSPTQRIGIILCDNAQLTLRRIKSLDSPKRVLLSECPQITYSQRNAFNIFGEISPVKAPLISGYIF